jgi:hypothetical protein
VFTVPAASVCIFLAPKGPYSAPDRCRTRTSQYSTNEQPPEVIRFRPALDVFQRQTLLRKEVIQPHLPVRLPCYDFVPIASPTFDHSIPNGLGHGLRVLPTFVT